MKNVNKLGLIGGAYFLLQKSILMSPEPPISAILRGQYENKIRRYSPPEKIFDVFATLNENGTFKMTLKDLLNAICFYNHSLSVHMPKIRMKVVQKDSAPKTY
eukprot:GHVR01030630.1.p1 GENE.GHVR01030630.1~~GHVR01030630.1.p1  ORF type:complete len:103 (+),score=2.52 GHVR01030630.1:2222-2530(+)